MRLEEMPRFPRRALDGGVGDGKHRELLLVVGEKDGRTTNQTGPGEISRNAALLPVRVDRFIRAIPAGRCDRPACLSVSHSEDKRERGKRQEFHEA